MSNYGNVLIDDLRSFIVEPAETLAIRTAREAEAFLATLTSDDVIGTLWLDHDLGLDERGHATDVMGFVRALEERFWDGSAPRIGNVVIHTSNPVGARNIEAALGRNVRCRRIDAREQFIA